MKIEFTGTVEWVNHEAMEAFFKEAASSQLQAFDDDGGMHTVGVQMMLGYETGEFVVDDLFMPIA
jgi:hypothetical protein